MKSNGIMTPKEETVMELLWDTQKPMTISEIGNVIKGKGWNKSTLFNTIQSLSGKNYIKVCGMEKNHTQYARQFEPGISKEDYAAIILTNKGIKRKDLGNIALAMSGANDDSDNKEELIRELELLINRLKGGEM